MIFSQNIHPLQFVSLKMIILLVTARAHDLANCMKGIIVYLPALIKLTISVFATDTGWQAKCTLPFKKLCFYELPTQNLLKRSHTRYVELWCVCVTDMIDRYHQFVQRVWKQHVALSQSSSSRPTLEDLR